MKKLKAVLWLVMFMLFGWVFTFAELILKTIAPFLVLFGSGKVSKYGMNILEGYDNFVSSQLGGDPDESISSRLGKSKLKGSGWTYIADKVDLVAEFLGDKPNHCTRSIELDEGKKQVTRY